MRTCVRRAFCNVRSSLDSDTLQPSSAFTPLLSLRSSSIFFSHHLQPSSNFTCRFSQIFFNLGTLPSATQRVASQIAAELRALAAAISAVGETSRAGPFTPAPLSLASPGVKIYSTPASAAAATPSTARGTVGGGGVGSVQQCALLLLSPPPFT